MLRPTHAAPALAAEVKVQPLVTAAPTSPAITKPASATPVPAVQPFPRQFVLQALEQSSDDSGWAHLGTFGGYLTKLQPDFDSRIYGFKKLSDLVRAKTEIFETKEVVPAGQTQSVLYIKAKS